MRIPPVIKLVCPDGPTHDGREGGDSLDIFAHEPFNLIPPSVALWPRVPVISGMVILEKEITETKDRCTTTWLNSGAV